jgi:putative two-component system response regulator
MGVGSVQAEHADARILILDDEPVNTVLLGRILAAAGYADVVSTTDPHEAIALFCEAVDSDRPFDLVCTDLHMPGLSGIEVLERLSRATPPDDFLPFLVLTADVTPEAEQEALLHGAKDFITKPFRPSQIRLRVANLLRTRWLQRQLRRHNLHLEELVRARTFELEAARLDILDRLAAAAEYRDYTTGQHTQRVGLLSGLLAERLGYDAETVELIRRAAPLHDVGKIGIPDSILLKPGRLSPTEFAQMKAHVDVGVRLLSRGHSKLIAMAEIIAMTHHERWDGSGYPRSLAGDDIPLVGQIVAVADVFDTLINERPYKRAWTHQEATAEMKLQRGRWFSPRLIDVFLQLLGDRPGLIDELAALGTEVVEPTPDRAAAAVAHAACHGPVAPTAPSTETERDVAVLLDDLDAASARG